MIDFDVRTIGRHMSRDRYQRGSLKKIGKRRKMWQARWHTWERQPDGTEKRRPRKQILGPVARMSKGDAQDKLDALIKAETSQISVLDFVGGPDLRGRMEPLLATEGRHLEHHHPSDRRFHLRWGEDV